MARLQQLSALQVGKVVCSLIARLAQSAPLYAAERTQPAVRDRHCAQLRNRVRADQLEPRGRARLGLLAARRGAERAGHAKVHVHDDRAVARAEEVEQVLAMALQQSPGLPPGPECDRGAQRALTAAAGAPQCAPEACR